jgi:uncharacterized protein (TIGR02217 family)
MAVDNLIMPETVSVGFRGGPTFSTDKVVAVNMQERRLQNLSKVRHVYSWNLQYADIELTDQLRAFWYDRRGDFKAFLMKDWTDFRAVGQSLGLGDGSQTTFPFSKTYSAGNNPYVRLLPYVKAATVVVYIDGHEADASSWSIVGGAVEFLSGNAPSLGEEVTADFEFYVPVRFDGDAFSASLPVQNENVVDLSDLKAIEVIP